MKRQILFPFLLIVPAMLSVAFQGCIAYVGAPTSVETSIDSGIRAQPGQDAETAAADGGATGPAHPDPVTPRSDVASTPLHLAAGGGDIQRVQLLVRDGADVNARDAAGQTPLHYAASNGHGQTTQTLMGLGADPSAKDHAGHAPRYYAERNGHSGTAEYLPGGATTALHEAASAGDPASVEAFVRKSIDINAKDEAGRTPLHLAAANGHGDTVKMLLRLGADAALLDGSGHTARDLAEANHHTNTASALPESEPGAVAGGSSPAIESGVV